MKKNVFVALLILFGSVSVFAQDTTAISDEELKKYAVTMDSINNMKEELLEEITTMVKENEEMTNARYNELSKIIKDEAKLQAAKATPEEIAFIKDVQAKKKEGTAEISEVFQNMARDYIGVAEYNEIKNALASDSQLKDRYNTILKEVEGSSAN